MRIRLLATAVVAALIPLLAFAATPAQANHSWGGYHWARTANPFTVKLGDNVTSNWDSFLNTASNDWTQSTVLNTTVVAGQSSSKRCAATTGRVEACNATYGNNGWLGIASISVTGGVHITQGTVKLNDTYFNTAQYNTSAWRALVMCQEVGHTFGLDHQDTDFNNANLGTCMDYTNDPSTNQHPNKHDYDELVTIYSHLDSFNTADQTLAASPAITDSPASWGRLVEGNASHGAGLYVRDLGHGNLIITHVLWA
ncbi:hypothetical protein R8Z50_10865 [Longispora sp. K20-0274]|uniref:hypothetical protein n=1 Tax=Longispora sp. K20-0274 TaxID=3088255 RepID=UPI003999CAE4